MRRMFPLFLAFFLLLTGCSGPADLVLSTVKAEEPPADYDRPTEGFRYARSQLTPQQQAVYDTLAAGLEAQEEAIEDLYPDVDLIQAAIDAIDKDYPEFFWFSGNGQIETTLMMDQPVRAAYKPQYLMDRSQRSETQAKINAWESACLAGLAENASDYEKALHVYRYIIDHADYQTVEGNSILHIMVDGAGLCGCYAKTAQYILNRQGIPCAYISGQAAGESHAWNLIWLEGTPCWMDVTWGDPVFDGGDPNDGPAYEYFGITTADLLRNHILDPGQQVPECVSEDYNYFRRSGLWFETYDTSAMVDAMAATLASGESRVCLRFSDDLWPQATHLLLDQGEIHRLLRQAAQQAGTRTPGDSLWYSRNDAFCTLTVKMSGKENIARPPVSLLGETGGPIVYSFFIVTAMEKAAGPSSPRDRKAPVSPSQSASHFTRTPYRVSSKLWMGASSRSSYRWSRSLWKTPQSSCAPTKAHKARAVSRWPQEA